MWCVALICLNISANRGWSEVYVTNTPLRMAVWKYKESVWECWPGLKVFLSYICMSFLLTSTQCFIKIFFKAAFSSRKTYFFCKYVTRLLVNFHDIWRSSDVIFCWMKRMNNLSAATFLVLIVKATKWRRNANLPKNKILYPLCSHHVLMLSMTQKGNCRVIWYQWI